MRSDRPTPGDPWPHDMVIAVNDADPLLTTLLFVNDAWDLQMTRIPPLAPPPGIGAAFRPATASVDEWRQRWRDAWGQAVAAAGNRPDPPAGWTADPDRVQQSMMEWMRSRPRRFTEVWGDEGFDHEAYRNWVSSLRPPERHHRRLEEHPERRALPALIGAWRRGLRTVVTMPFARHWSAQGGPHHLLIAEMTRNDIDHYTARLNLFGPLPRP
jgi:hypothetical protein